MEINVKVMPMDGLLKIAGEMFKTLDMLTENATQQFAVLQILNTLVTVKATEEGVKNNEQ